MLTESQARDLFRETANGIPAPAPPTAAVLHRGRRIARFRRVTQVGGVVAAVVLVITTGLTWRPDLGLNDERRATGTATPPASPAGTRLVGMGRVAVVVPQQWGTNDVACDGHTAVRDTVVFDSEGVRSCLVPPDKAISSLHIVILTSSWAQPYVNDAEPAGVVDGLTLARTPTRESAGVHTGALVVASERVVMWVESPSARVVEEVLGSMAVVPAGFVAIPFDANVPLASNLVAIESAGFEVEVIERARPGWSAGSLVSTQPPLGSVVPVGSTVRLVTTGDPPGRPTSRCEQPVRLRPRSGPVGTRVRIEGCLPQGLGSLPKKVELSAWLSRQFGPPRECQLSAGNGQLRQAQDSSVRGWIRVSARGSCKQHRYDRRVTPGVYTLVVHCQACQVEGARFRVTPG